jgi:hypothetical protein
MATTADDLDLSSLYILCVLRVRGLWKSLDCRLLGVFWDIFDIVPICSYDQGLKQGMILFVNVTFNIL